MDSFCNTVKARVVNGYSRFLLCIGVRTDTLDFVAIVFVIPMFCYSNSWVVNQSFVLTVDRSGVERFWKGWNHLGTPKWVYKRTVWLEGQVNDSKHTLCKNFLQDNTFQQTKFMYPHLNKFRTDKNRGQPIPPDLLSDIFWFSGLPEITSNNPSITENIVRSFHSLQWPPRTGNDCNLYHFSSIISVLSTVSTTETECLRDTKLSTHSD